MLCPCTLHFFVLFLVHLFLAVSRDRVFRRDSKIAHAITNYLICIIDKISLCLTIYFLEQNTKIVQRLIFYVINIAIFLWTPLTQLSNTVYIIQFITCKHYFSHPSNFLPLVYMFVIDLQQYKAICEKLNFPYENLYFFSIQIFIYIK